MSVPPQITYSSFKNYAGETDPEARTWAATEKIHGANACLASYTANPHWGICSRNSFLGAVIDMNDKQFFATKALFVSLLPTLDLVLKGVVERFPEAKAVYIYGEVFGPGIQKGTRYCKDKNFYAFDIGYTVEDELIFLDDEEFHRVCSRGELKYSRHLYRGTLEEVVKFSLSKLKDCTGVPEELGLTGLPPYVREGHVIRCLEPGRRMLYKHKGEMVFALPGPTTVLRCISLDRLDCMLAKESEGIDAKTLGQWASELAADALEECKQSYPAELGKLEQPTSQMLKHAGVVIGQYLKRQNRQ